MRAEEPHLICLLRGCVLLQDLLAGGGLSVQGDSVSGHAQDVLHQRLVGPGVLYRLQHRQDISIL